MQRTNSAELFDRAKTVIPGGVNSPVRAFKAVGGSPVFMKSAKGALLTDVDGNEYVDMINSWGPMILGHAHPVIEAAVVAALQHSPSFGAPTAREVEMATVISTMVPSIEMVRMVNSGTEATMSAVRVARGFTRREKIVKMEGCYHGHYDGFLIAAGSGALTFGTPDSPGVTVGTAKDTLIVPYNDIEAVEKVFTENPGSIAALILEPVVGNMGCVVPLPGYLQKLRTLCDAHGVVLIFDEVMTGFRLAPGGAQELYGVKPDLTTLGKIIGGGLPVGAFGGRKEIMECVAPSGPVYQAGTLSGNPLAMAAGLAMLGYLKQHPEIYPALNQKTTQIVTGLRAIFDAAGIPVWTNQVGSMFTLFFTSTPVTDFTSAVTSDTKMFARFFQGMLAEGIYLAPSQYEAMFISDTINDQHIAAILDSAKKVVASF